jgi:type II secretory pathway pseudopilin PulG
MMVVIGVFGLLTALSLPAFSRYARSNRISTSVSRFAADLQMARATAIANGQVIEVATTGNSYRITDISTGDVLQNRTLESGVEVEVDTQVRFYPWGVADPANFNVGCSVSGYKAIHLLPTGVVEVD